MPTDVLLVSLGATYGWRVSDAALADSMRRAGATVEVVTAQRPREVRTFALTDLAWALAARRAAKQGIEQHAPRAIVYSAATAALLAPRPGAVRFDALHAGNRPGRHGVWQRPRERQVLAAAPLLIPWSALALEEGGQSHRAHVVVPPPVAPSGPPAPVRDMAAVTYASDTIKKGLPDVLDAWARARREGEELVVFTDKALPQQPGVRTAALDDGGFRALVRRSRAYVVAPRREDFGIAQLEALADGCVLVTTAPPGPYVARDLARQLDPRLVTDTTLDVAIRAALDDPRPGYAEHARELLQPFAPEAVDATVANELLPRLLP